MERKIGEVFKRNGEWYQCVEAYDKCSHCCFEINYYTCGAVSPCCSAPYRKDRKNVIFKKLEKVGEPFERNGYMYQEYKTHTYPLLMSGDAKIPTDNGFAVIIKQNKEDMKTVKISNDDFNFLVNKIRYGILPNHINYDKITNEISKLFSIDNIEDSNSENIGKNLKPFDLEAAKAGKPVCTRDGRKARIICFDAKKKRNIIALIQDNEFKDEEIAVEYFPNGCPYDNDFDTSLDLMMLPEKKEGWVNVYKNPTTHNIYTSADIFESKEIAEEQGTQRNRIATCKITWEE